MKAHYQKKLRLQRSPELISCLSFMHHGDAFQHKLNFFLLQAVYHLQIEQSGSSWQTLTELVEISF